MAEHSWRLAILVLLAKDELSQSFDMEKALRFALLHDIPEIFAGDEPWLKEADDETVRLNNNDELQSKVDRERAAAEKLFSVLTQEKRSFLYDTWKEYECQDCFEAQVVRALDKIEATLQVIEYQEGHMYQQHLEFSIGYMQKLANVDPWVQAFADHVEQELRTRFKEFEIKNTPHQKLV